ncbi:8621_t:CDS:1, partial [Dentiscutata erythropus]
MSDYFAKLRAYDQLLSNWYTNTSPNMSPKEYSYYKDLLHKVYAG